MMHYAGATHQGHRRENNEDAFVILEDIGAAIIADGMGGQNCGEVGSEITIRATTEYLGDPEAGLSAVQTATESIRAANRDVIAAAKVRTECEGMGSTIVMALWRGADVVIANVGDSRAYLYRDGILSQLSYDQNFANELRNKLGFTEERLKNMPNGHVLTMAVGSFEHVQVRTHTEALLDGDRILLCSDGLHGPVSAPAIADILRAGGTLESQVQNLIDQANRNGGPDNITAVLLQYTNP
jgi:protein phosphatase